LQPEPVPRSNSEPVAEEASKPVKSGAFEDALLRDRNKTGLFRAATLTFYEGGSKFIGHGFIAEMADNKLYICTVAHVAEALRAESSTVNIPGIGRKYVSLNTFGFEQDKDDYEAIAFHSLRPQTIDQIRRLEENGNFLPLRPAGTFGNRQETYAIPRTDLGEYNYFSLIKHVPEEDVYLLYGGGNNIVCAGQSGSPILKAPFLEPTNEFIGILSKSTNMGTELTDPHGLYYRCTSIFFARANNHLAKN
jgi:hypothetical protein